MTASLHRSRKAYVIRGLAVLVLAFLPLAGGPAYADTSDSVVQVASPAVHALSTLSSGEVSILAAGDDSPSVGARAGETDFLPAWRWQNIDLDQDSGGLLGAVKSMPNAIAMILFAFANFLWQILLNITKLGLSADFITPAAPAINAGVAQMGELVFIFGALLLAVVFWKAAKGVMSGAGVTAFMRVFICVVWLLGILGIQRVSAEAAEAFDPNADRRVSAEAQASYPGTMPWVLRTVTSSVDKTASRLVTSWGLRDRMANASGGISEASTPKDVLTCDTYIKSIHQQYLDYQTSTGGKPANSSLSGLSNLWESTLYRSWTTAQFSASGGDTDLGARVMCHYAESVNNISASEQAAIAAAAYKVGPFKGGPELTVFGPHNSDSDRRRAVAAWANCQLVGGKMSATPETANSFDGNKAKHDRDCASSTEAFSTSKDGLDGMYLDVFGNGEEAFQVDGKEAELEAARKWENAWFGSNSAERVLNALLALLVALGMVWSLGFVAIGLVMVQFTMVILLLFVPVMLAFLAIGVKTDKVAGLFKLLGTSTFTKAFFGFLIAMIIEIASIGQGIVNFIPGGGGLFGQVLKGLMPLAALLVMRRLLTSFGLGDIMRPMGAVSFATASAVMATADKSGVAAKFNSGVTGSIMSKTGAERMLKKADRYAPVLENWNKEGRQARREDIEAAREQRRSDRADERENRGSGALDRLKDWANSRGWDMDRAESAASAGLKGATVAGAAVVSGGAAPLFTGILGGAAAAKKANSLKIGRKSKRDIDLDGLPNVELGKDGSISATAADAQMRAYKRRRARADESGLGTSSVDEEYVENAMNASFTNRYGAGFEGFDDERHALGAKASFARQKGYDYDAVNVSSNGIILPDPVAPEDRSSLTVEQLSDWVHWLPETDTRMRTDEGNDEYLSRLFATGVARGLVSEDGASVDIWSKLGLDMNNQNDRRRVEGFLRGERKDDLLSKTVFESRNSAAERVMINRIQGISGGANVSDRRDLHNIHAMREAINTVRKGMSEQLTTTRTSKQEMQTIAESLISAQSKLRVETDVEQRKVMQEAVNKQREQFHAQVDAMNRQLFVVAQELVSQRADLLVGTGQIVGHEALEQFVATALTEHVERIQELESARDGVLLGRMTTDQLVEMSSQVEAGLRTNTADLIREASAAAEFLGNRVKKEAIQMNRIGSAIKTMTPTRNIVSEYGSSRFPNAEKADKPGRKSRVRAR